MFETLNRFWIFLPLSYAVTVSGLVTGYRRGGAPAERRLFRAICAGLPVMICVVIAWTCIVQIVEEGIQAPPLLGLHTVLFIVFLLSTSALTGSVLARRKPTSSIERGTVVLDAAPTVLRSVPHDTLTLAGHPIPVLDETKHFKMIGTTGTGKSTAIRELLKKALNRGDRAVIADPDGGYLRSFYDADRGDIILNPFDSRSARWDIFSEIILPHDADQLARSLIPEEKGDDHIWRGFARTYVSCILRQLCRIEQRNATALYYLLTEATEDKLRDLLEGTPAARFLGKQGGKFLQSVQSVANQHLGAIEYIGRQNEGHDLSVRRWIREGRGVLFLPYSANEIASLRSLISTWMRLTIFETLSGPEGGQRIWFAVDELDALGPIDGLKDALTRLRKVNGRCILGLQSIGQVSGSYGVAQGQSIVENCGNTVILRCSASEHGGTAEFASRLIGKHQIFRPQHSVSRATGHFFKKTRTVSDHHSVEDAVMASEIEQLPDLTGFLKLASQPHWQRVTFARNPG